MPRVLAASQVKIASEEDVAVARRMVRAVAQQRGFDRFATAAITTAASELGRNIWVHAAGGSVAIEELAEGERAGIRLRFEDDGPGIVDTPTVLAGGHSSIRSLGLGLVGSRRLVDQFDLQTAIGVGTTVTVVKWARF